MDSETYTSKDDTRKQLELELIQTQMTQKPMLRAEVYAPINSPTGLVSPFESLQARELKAFAEADAEGT
jgi:hypothetical protein